jgi:hypothetical protein
MAPKYRVFQLLEVEQYAATGLSLQDAIMCVLKCGPAEAAELSKDPQITDAHARGQAEGARTLLAAMAKLAGTGHAGAAKLVLAAQRQAGAAQDDIALADRWRVEGDVSVAPSVRAGFATQRQLIEKMFDKQREEDDNG